MAVEIGLFGGWRVVLADGAEVRFPTRKAAALLAVLAVEPGSEHSRDALAAMLWPASGESQARASLRQTLAQLRKALGPAGPRIEARQDRLRLNPEGLRVDTIELVAAAGSDVSGDSLERGLRCYRGEFLEGEGPLENPFDEWLRDRRQHYVELALRAIGRLLAEHVDAGRIEEGTALAERGLAIDPTRESIHRALMRLHLAAGRRGQAVRAYERCRDKLRERLGLSPGDETEELYRSIVEDGRAGAAAPPTSTAELLPRRAASIAVLPFDNLSPDPEQGYFADGIAEDIITELSRFRTLAVTSRNSSFAYRGHGKPVREIAAELGVTYVLEGSVRRADDRLRVTAQLIDGRDEKHVWADRYDAGLAGMFDVQDEITRAVVGALARNIDGAHLEQARRRRPEDLAVYDLWLHGMDCIRRGTPESDEQARGYFERALEIDPYFSRAYAGISLTHFNDWSCQAWDRWGERERGAFENARRAVELDDGDHLAHCILGRIRGYRLEFALAEKHFDRALGLNPNDADCLMQISMGKTLLGHHEMGVELAETALKLNPRHGDWYYGVAAIPLLMLRRYEAALNYAERAPDVFVDSRALLAGACARLGREEEARRHADLFLKGFKRKIAPGRDPEPGEAVRWMLHVNPFRLDSDRKFVRETLALAGL
jgi:TolB-like protein